MGLTEKVTKDTEPRKRLVPMLMRMDTPMAARNSTGSIHESVETTSKSTMMGTTMATALSTWSTMDSRIWAVSMASPATALPDPASSTRARRAAMAGPSSPSVTDTWNRAAPSR